MHSAESAFPATTAWPTKRGVAAAAGAMALLIAAGTAQAALQNRDLDGDSVEDAFYDTDLNITWLRNANVSGPMDWSTAMAWAAAFSFGGYDDWRLPTAAPPPREGPFATAPAPSRPGRLHGRST